ncbi:unnamed protein product [Heligmosomoides polygyrus]|uniref:Uncharacterized protein n=1 Tax=Heligmosomoides polygyrus TaxID=6339 RepID=A0A183FGD7_HELPZ|nr:unnamed protein product [Heligmosomoides polygyrus]
MIKKVYLLTLDTSQGAGEEIEAQCEAIQEQLVGLKPLRTELSLKALASELGDVLVVQQENPSPALCSADRGVVEETRIPVEVPRSVFQAELSESTDGAPVHGLPKALALDDVFYRAGSNLVAAAQGERLKETYTRFEQSLCQTRTQQSEGKQEIWVLTLLQYHGKLSQHGEDEAEADTPLPSNA